MKGVSRTALAIAVLLVAASALAQALQPTRRLADAGTALQLEQAFPATFGEWRIDPGIVPVPPSPDVQGKLDQIYSETLARTYVNARGEHIMLSVAYGRDQSGDVSQVHRPEVCYKSQGFQLLSSMDDRLTTAYGSLPVRRLVARLSVRNEPITYWITVGDQATLPGIGRKLVQLKYGLKGVIPDGMLVRVSSIDNDPTQAYRLQDDFIRALFAAVAPEARARVSGIPRSPA